MIVAWLLLVAAACCVGAEGGQDNELSEVTVQEVK
jgi:hypothetical protein